LVLSFEYHNTFDPPAPVITVHVGRSDGEQHEPVLALLDSGADISVVPPEIISRLGLVPIGEMQAVVIEDGVRRTVWKDVYNVHINIADGFPGFNYETMEFTWETAESTVPEHLTLGRDVLNRYNLTLEGPSLEGMLLRS
jgi:hypothetical protein